MIQVLVNADDFGLTRGVNHAIIDCYRYGLVNSTTMLVNMPAASHAAELAKANPGLRVGIHLTLTCGKPVSDAPSLTKADGTFRLSNRYGDETVDVIAAEQEWEAQIHKFLSYGLEPSHLDSHHHIHCWEPLFPVIQRLSQKYGLPVRNGFSPEKAINRLSDELRTDFYGDGVTLDYFNKLESTTGSVIEIMCHPAYVDAELRRLSSYCDKRADEAKVLINSSLPSGFVLLGR
ncbi:chitin disaccharide deacetylase [Ectobacillus sp. JY-23]|uniref:chitin disaccharide deacetylase n=1 Tax=Ectobacillus sp. JY-23 TaxID=2933872 RepID=UPI001FF4FF43|nr:chitin disaccharide deacetylase [Ectobacillus sp. JY-23]UOY91009.1 chitin disaccharide deacetylase [Ectobacillus sp. JY-23]